MQDVSYIQHMPAQSNDATGIIMNDYIMSIACDLHTELHVSIGLELT